MRKLHLAVGSDKHDSIAAQMNLESVDDSQVRPALLNPLRRKVKQVNADCAYDTKDCYKLVGKKKATATIPPRKNAGYWEENHIRNKAIAALKAVNLSQWKRESGYHKRSLSETAMYRYKTQIDNQLGLRCHDAQVAEVLVVVKALNRVIRLGMPERQDVSK